MADVITLTHFFFFLVGVCKKAILGTGNFGIVSRFKHKHLFGKKEMDS